MKFITIMLATLIIFSRFVFAEGDWSGSGDYGHSEKVYKLSKNLITIYLSNLSKEDWTKIKREMPRPRLSQNTKTYFDLKEEVSKESLIHLIYNIRPNFEKFVGIKFMNWDKDGNGEVYIELLNPYFQTFGQYWDDKSERLRVGPRSPVIAESMLRMIKESSHTWGYDDEQGQDFSEKMIKNIQNYFPSQVKLSMGLIDYDHNIIPPYAIKFIALDSGNYQFYKCDVSKLSINCSKRIGPKAGFTSENLKDYSDRFRLLIRRKIIGSTQILTEFGLTGVTFFASGVCVVGGFFGGLVYTKTVTGTLGGTGAGIVCAGTILDLSHDYILEPLSEYSDLNFTSSEYFDFTNIEVEKEGYYFFKDMKSIIEFENQVILHEDWFNGWSFF